MKVLIVTLILAVSFCFAQEQNKDELKLSKEKINQRIQYFQQVIQQKIQERDQLDTDIKVFTGALNQLRVALSDSTLFVLPEEKKPAKEKK